MSSRDTNVGSPPMVSASPAARSRSSTAAPDRCRASTWAGLYGLVTRGSSWMRRTVLEKANSTSAGPVAPVIGAEEAGVGVAESGMCPSPANSADVASRPIQPAPGTYTSAHACRSVKSSAGPPCAGSSEASCTR